jgi:hypothetical protein
MPSWVLGVAGTVVVSTISAYVFLRLRCRRVGNPFGRRARWWAMTIIAGTVVVSTAVGLGLVAVSHHIRAAYVGLVLPSALWFGRASIRRDGHRDGTITGALLDRVLFPLRRLDDLMGEDMQDWCDDRSRAVAGRPAWVSAAAHYYYRQVAGRIKDPRAREDLNRWRESIEHKIAIVRLVDLDSLQRLRAALQSHASTRNTRKYNPDDPRLADRLRSDAENELHLFLFTLYRLGFYKLLIYPFRPPTPPRRRRRLPGTPAGAEPTVR